MKKRKEKLTYFKASVFHWRRGRRGAVGEFEPRHASAHVGVDDLGRGGGRSAADGAYSHAGLVDVGAVFALPRRRGGRGRGRAEVGAGAPRWCRRRLCRGAVTLALTLGVCVAGRQRRR